MAQDLIDRLSREELAEDYLDDEAMSLVIDKVKNIMQYYYISKLNYLALDLF